MLKKQFNIFGFFQFLILTLFSNTFSFCFLIFSQKIAVFLLNNTPTTSTLFYALSNTHLRDIWRLFPHKDYVFVINHYNCPPNYPPSDLSRWQTTPSAIPRGQITDQGQSDFLSRQMPPRRIKCVVRHHFIVQLNSLKQFITKIFFINMNYYREITKALSVALKKGLHKFNFRDEPKDIREWKNPINLKDTTWTWNDVIPTS